MVTSLASRPTPAVYYDEGDHFASNPEAETRGALGQPEVSLCFTSRPLRDAVLLYWQLRLRPERQPLLLLLLLLVVSGSQERLTSPHLTSPRLLSLSLVPRVSGVASIRVIIGFSVVNERMSVSSHTV